MATSTAGPGAGPAHTHHTRSTVARAALSLLAVLALYQGIWAQLAPRSFFEGFPGGMGWIATEGPYNEHLVRDVGGLVNGLAVVALVAAWTFSRAVVVATALAWLVYGVPHFAFHVVHPVDGASAQAVNVVVLASEVVLPVLALLLVAWPHEHQVTRTTSAGAGTLRTRRVRSTTRSS